MDRSSEAQIVQMSNGGAKRTSSVVVEVSVVTDVLVEVDSEQVGRPICQCNRRFIVALIVVPILWILRGYFLIKLQISKQKLYQSKGLRT